MDARDERVDDRVGGLAAYRKQLLELRARHLERRRAIEELLAQALDAKDAATLGRAQALLTVVDDEVAKIERAIRSVERQIVRLRDPDLHLRTIRIDRELDICLAALARPQQRPRMREVRPRLRNVRTSPAARRGPPSDDSDPHPPDPGLIPGFLDASVRAHAHMRRRAGAEGVA